MNDQEIYLLLKQAGNSLQAIFDYFKKKNKILFDSSTSWDSGTKTIKDISKYNLIQVDLDLGGVSGIAIRRSDTVFTGTVNANYPLWMGVTAFFMSLNGDSCKLDWGWVNVNTPQDFNPCGDINKQCSNTFCRDIQFRNLCEYKQNSHIGIQTTNWLHGRINSLRQIKEMGWCV